VVSVAEQTGQDSHGKGGLVYAASNRFVPGRYYVRLSVLADHVSYSDAVCSAYFVLYFADCSVDHMRAPEPDEGNTLSDDRDEGSLRERSEPFLAIRTVASGQDLLGLSSVDAFVLRNLGRARLLP
jgi:hypothetical protein